MAVTIRDVAALAGVSPSTVSRTCRNNPSISEETKERVRRAAKQLGYAMEGISTPATRTVGVILPPSAREVYENPFYLEMIRGINQFCNAHQYVSTIVTGRDNDEILAAIRLLVSTGAANAFILLYSRQGDTVIDYLVHPAEYGVTFVTEKLVADGKEFPEVQAAVSIRHEICNQTKEQKTCVVCTKLSDPQGTPVAEWKEQVQIPAGNMVSCNIYGTIRDPKCWSPEHPDLYGMETWYETTDEDGKKISYLADTQKVGIRVAEFDADRGFFLNGVPMKIKGVCVHHDAGCLGAAVTKEIWHRRLAKLKECGCNAIRCSHNPHMPELYELCDTMGFLVMDEAFDEWENAKNKWSTGHNVYPPKHQGYFEERCCRGHRDGCSGRKEINVTERQDWNGQETVDFAHTHHPRGGGRVRFRDSSVV